MRETAPVETGSKIRPIPHGGNDSFSERIVAGGIGNVVARILSLKELLPVYAISGGYRLFSKVRGASF